MKKPMAKTPNFSQQPSPSQAACGLNPSTDSESVESLDSERRPMPSSKAFAQSCSGHLDRRLVNHGPQRMDRVSLVRPALRSRSGRGRGCRAHPEGSVPDKYNMMSSRCVRVASLVGGDDHARRQRFPK